MKIFIKIIFIAAFSFTLSFSQNILTLDKSISIALNESYGIQSARFSLNSSKKALEALKLGLRTSINMQFDIPRYSRSLSSQFNPAIGIEEFYEIGNTTFEGRLFFTQPIIFTNGTFSLVGSLWQRDQFNALQAIPKDYYTNLSLRLSQPLFTFNTQAANLTRAEINLEKAERNYSSAEKEIIYNVTSEFFRLYQAKKNVEITKEKVKQNETSYNTAANKFKAGLIAEVEALQLEIDLASSKNDLLDAERRFQEAKDEFKLLIGLPLEEKIDVSAQLEYKPIEVNLNQAIQYALNNRNDLKNAESDIQLRNLNIDEIDSRGDVSGLLTVNYGINKSDDQLRNIFYDFAKDRSLVLTLSVPILDWGKNNREVESAEANLNLAKLNYQNQKKQIKQEITSLINEIESAKARVEVLSKSVDVAQKSYDMSLSRFQSGTITSFDLSQMQLRLTGAKTNSLNALIDYNLAVADLERKTFHNYK